MPFPLSVNRRRKFWGCLPMGLVSLLPSICPGADPDKNFQVSFSLGAAFNISAQFRGHPGNLNLQNPQAQSGATFFDNGYVGLDVSGDPNFTTFWGYDRADQPVISGGNVIGLNYERTTVAADAISPRLDADPSPGAEIVVRRRLANSSRVAFGVEFGASYTRLDLDDRSPYTADGQRTGYSFALPSPVDAALFPPPGYQGPFNGLGPILNPSQTTGATTSAPGAVAVSGRRQVEADVFGFRLGPYLEFPFNEQFTATFSVGAVVAVIADQVTWSENVSVNSATATGYWTGQASASGSRCGVAYGYYLGADVSWNMNEHWSVVAGGQWRSLGTYEHKIGAGEMKLDLKKSIIISLGIRYSF